MKIVGGHVQWPLHFKTTSSARKYSIKLKVALKCRDVYTENVRVMSLIMLMAGLKIEGNS